MHPAGVRGLVSERSVRYRELEMAGKELSDEAWARLLAEEPGMLKRPIITDGNHVLVGYDETQLARMFGH